MPRRLSFLLVSLCALPAFPGVASASASDLRLSGVASPEQSTQRVTPKQALANAKQAKQGIGVRRGLEVTLALRVLAQKLPYLSGADQRRAQRLLARPSQGQGTAGDEVSYAAGTTERSQCGEHFCVHWVDTTADAPSPVDTGGTPGVPDYVETMLAVFENVYNVENVQLGWQAAKPDFGRGGDDRVDVYIGDVGKKGIFGYSAPDPDQPGIRTDPRHLAAYLVMDNDYAEKAFTDRYANNLLPMEVTAAHEYAHVLQFNYDAQQDNWMFEASAVWMEDKVYDTINDYVSYLTPWAKDSLTPLTQAASGDGQSTNIKIYGDAVFPRWIDQHYGPDTIKRAWELSVATKDFAPGAFDGALREKGTTFAAAYSQFAAETAEWRTGSLFEEGDTWPDMSRVSSNGQDVSIAPGSGGVVKLDHTAFGLVGIDPQGQGSLTVSGALPRGTAGAIALVGRSGPDVGGTPSVTVKMLPSGGRGSVMLQNAGNFQRLTAVVINADVHKHGFSEQLADWVWSKDSQPFAVALNDSDAPKVQRRVPKRSAKSVSTKSKVTFGFTEYVDGASAKTVKLLGPGGRLVKARVHQSFDQNAGGTVVQLLPSKRLRSGTGYTVKLGAITDAAGNPLASSQRSWRFTTSG